MINIKSYTTGNPWNYNSIIFYDEHTYKEDRLLNKHKDYLKTLDLDNVCLVDNVDEFRKNLKQYKKDLKACYKAEDHLEDKLNEKEIERRYWTSKVMRSFRISIDHIELNSLHKPTDDLEQKRQNVINYYKHVLNEFEKLLNQNMKFDDKVHIIKADLHFDQTSPHIHVHVSNLYQKEIKKINKLDAWTCNSNISDAIMILNKEKANIYKQTNEIVKVNEIFSRKIRSIDDSYALTNRINLKELFPNQYNIYALMRKADIIDKNWRKDKERYFNLAKANLIKFGLKIDRTNDIANTTKLNELTEYCFKQSLFKEFTKNQTRSIEEIQNFFNDNKAIAKLIDESNQVLELEKQLKVIELENNSLKQENENLKEQVKTIENDLNKNQDAIKELNNKIEKNASLIQGNNIDQRIIKNELEHKQFLGLNSNFLRDFITPDNFISKENLNSISMNISFFDPSLKNIENEIQENLFLSQKWTKLNGIEYVNDLKQAQINPNMKLNYNFSQDAINEMVKVQPQQNKQEVKQEIKQNINNEPDIKESAMIINSHSQMQSFRKTRTLADIEREEELKKQQEYRRSI